MRRVGILGGTFDPVHYGHLVIAEEVYDTLRLAEMVFIPTGQPPHKTNEVVTAAGHRLAMLELAIASNPHFSISRVDLDRPGPSYTVDTLRLLRKQWGEQAAIYFVIGWDSLEELLTWHDAAGVLQQLTHLVAVRRPGYNEAGDRLRLRKPHPCGGYDWQIVRLGADIGLRCEKCGRRVLLPRAEVERRTKQVLSRAIDTDTPSSIE